MAAAWCSTQGGELVARAPQFEESLTLVDLDVDAVLHHRLRDPAFRARRGPS